MVESYDRYQYIDHNPGTHEQGNISEEHNWKWLAVDVIHYWQGMYLTIVNSQMGQMAIWRDLTAGTADKMTYTLNKIFQKQTLWINC